MKQLIAILTLLILSATQPSMAQNELPLSADDMAMLIASTMNRPEIKDMLQQSAGEKVCDFDVTADSGNVKFTFTMVPGIDLGVMTPPEQAKMADELSTLFLESMDDDELAFITEIGLKFILKIKDNYGHNITRTLN